MQSCLSKVGSCCPWAGDMILGVSPSLGLSGRGFAPFEANRLGPWGAWSSMVSALCLCRGTQASPFGWHLVKSWAACTPKISWLL